MEKEEITRRVHEEVLATGRMDRSLRDLGGRVGVSARMLIYHFGSREELLQSVLQLERELQTKRLEALVARGVGPIELLRGYLWEMTEPAHRGRLRFFFDLVAEAFRDPERYERFLREELVGFWKKEMLRLLENWGYRGVPWELVRLSLAAARGLYLEALATGDVESIRRSFDRLCLWLEGELEAYRPPP